ncbi:MAG: RNA polymerase sigma factor [Planctomycetota bacterium]
MDQPIDAAAYFLRWRDRGDTAAIGHAFDLTSRELFLIAMHLTGRREEAEELVQSTFLVALERARAFDDTKALLPWLSGILVRQARHNRRRATRPVDAARVTTPTAADPAEVLASREVEELVAVASDELPPPYREVITLRLREGLETRAIATALGRPFETVRTQLQRGLARLRRRLPQGLHGVLGAAALCDLDLAGVRTTTLKAATRVGPFVPPDGATATATTQRLVETSTLAKAAAVVGMVLLTGATGLLWRNGPGDMPAPSTNQVSATMVGQPTTAAGPVPDPTRRTRAAIAVPTVEPDAQALPQDASTKTLMLGIVVRDEDGTPIRDAVVSVSGNTWNDRPMTAVQTDATGGFTLQQKTEEHITYRVEINAEDRVPVAAPTTLAPGSRWDFGTVRMKPSAQRRGRIVDQHSQPVADVEIAIATYADRLLNDRRGKVRYIVEARSDRHGNFELPRGLPPGSHGVVIGTPGLVPDSALELRPLGSPASTLSVISGQPTIRAHVTGQRGAPVPGVRVSARAGLLSVYSESDASGVAVLTKPLAASSPAQIFVLGHCPLSVSPRRGAAVPATTSQPSPADVRVPWGEEVDVVVRAPSSIALEVVDPSGAPVERFGIVGGTNRDHNATGHYPGGHAEITVNNDRPLDFVVLPKDPQLAPSQRLTVHTTEGERRPLRIELAASHHTTVEVVDHTGVPVPGAHVEWIDPAPGTTFDATASDDPLHWQQTTVRVGGSRTDARGRAFCAVPPKRTGLVVRARGAGFLPKVVAGATTAHGGKPIRVTVSRGGAMNVALDPRTLIDQLDLAQAEREWNAYGTPQQRKRAAQMYPGVVLLDHRDTSIAYRDRINHPFDPKTGSVRLSGLEPGRYEVQLGFYSPNGRLIQPDGARCVIQVHDGQTARATLRARDVRLGSWRGTVRWQGTPFQDTEIALKRLGSAVVETWGRYKTDDEGVVVVPAILPGEYRVCLKIDGNYRPFGSTVRIEAGQRSTRDVVAVTVPLDLEIVDAEGQPIPKQWVSIQSPDRGWFAGVQTDQGGRASVQHALPGPLKLNVGNKTVEIHVALGERGRRTVRIE